MFAVIKPTQLNPNHASRGWNFKWHLITSLKLGQCLESCGTCCVWCWCWCYCCCCFNGSRDPFHECTCVNCGHEHWGGRLWNILVVGSTLCHGVHQLLGWIFLHFNSTEAKKKAFLKLLFPEIVIALVCVCVCSVCERVWVHVPSCAK